MSFRHSPINSTQQMYKSNTVFYVLFGEYCEIYTERNSTTAKSHFPLSGVGYMD